ncbi:MAG: DUF3857 domain-containing protein, partial [Actinomycetota bacterium]|nr:DUF3857 domain-containing protein [Actinomycetota bacterium]
MCAPARAAGPVILVLGAVLAWVLGPAAALASTGDAVVASSASANGIAPRFGVAPPPDWVVDVEVPDTAGVSDDLLHDGIADLLSDIQVRIGDGPEQRFSRYVSEVVEPSGVSSVGRIQIEFAATYQELEIHWIRLVRDGVVQERLDASDVRIIQQEEDLGLDLYYQNATALVLLDDVRVGDRVDYAYSIVGANPIFGGRYVDWLHLEWWYPFGRIHNRIVAPRDRTLYFELHNTDEGPEIRPVPGHDDLVEHVFVRDDVEAVLSEDETPADHSPLAAHQVSEFETWGEVARWSAETFDHGGEPGDAVRELAAGIREQHETTEEQIISALRYVQDEVRYLGLEIGVNAYRPHRPALTLERRF